jgi:hypothetical protein
MAFALFCSQNDIWRDCSWQLLQALDFSLALPVFKAPTGRRVQQPFCSRLEAARRLRENNGRRTSGRPARGGKIA